MILTIFYARILDIDIIFYDQSPLYGDKVRYHKRKIAAYIYYFLNREPFVRITPVLGDEGCDIARPRSYYVPFVAPTWLSPDERSYLEDGYVDIVMIGKLHQERKNHLMLLDVIDELEATYRLRLTIIGSLVDDSHPYYQRLLAYVDDHGLTETVTIKQNLSYHDVQQEYRCHDLYVLPSRDEPAAVSHLEAMNAGLPVICSDSNGTRHYIEKEKNGYLFSCGNRDDLARNVERIVASEERVRSFGRRSLELAQTEYSPEKFYDRLSDIVSDNF
jgi:glycosyltransferase involved in cell wall biosynthesis